MIIDVHTHIMPREFPPVGARAAGPAWPSMAHGAGGRADVMIEGANYRTVAATCWDVPARVAAFPSEGVDRHVLSPMPRLLDYTISASDGLDLARHLNETIAAMVREAPDRFYGLGSVPLQDPALAARELPRLRDLGLRGIEVSTNIAGRNIGDAAFRPFLKEVERLDLAIFSHAQFPTFRDRLPGALTENSVAFPIENALALSSAIIQGVFEECPSLRICFSHGGGVFPFMLPRIENQWQGGGPFRAALPKSPTEYARMAYYDDVLFDHRALRYLLDVVGTSQVMVGSDFPFADWRSRVHADEEFTALGLSAAEREAIGSANALRFLGLACP